jgi:hypothetical protein
MQKIIDPYYVKPNLACPNKAVPFQEHRKQDRPRHLDILKS